MSMILFMLVSAIEGFAVMSLMLNLFRYTLKDIWIETSILIAFIGIISYLTRMQFDVSNYTVPIIVFSLIAYLFIVVNVPLLWSIIVVGTGYFAYGLVNTLVLVILNVTSVIEFNNIGKNSTDDYILQLSSATMSFLLSRSLFNRGLGFTYKFSSFRIKGENYLILALVFIFMVTISIILANKASLIAAFTLVLFLSMLLVLQIRRELGK